MLKKMVMMDLLKGKQAILIFLATRHLHPKKSLQECHGHKFWNVAIPNRYSDIDTKTQPHNIGWARLNLQRLRSIEANRQ